MLPPRLAGHMERCQSCRSFYESSVTLGRQLALQAADEYPQIEGRGPARGFREAADRVARVKVVKIGMLAAASLIIAGVIVVTLVVNGIDGKEGYSLESGGVMLRVGSAIDFFSSEVERLMGAQSTPDLADVVEESLRSELLLVRNDAESAARFLAGCVAVDISAHSVGREAD